MSTFSIVFRTVNFLLSYFEWSQIYEGLSTDLLVSCCSEGDFGSFSCAWFVFLKLHKHLCGGKLIYFTEMCNSLFFFSLHTTGRSVWPK